MFEFLRLRHLIERTTSRKPSTGDLIKVYADQKDMEKSVGTVKQRSRIAKDGSDGRRAGHQIVG